MSYIGELNNWLGEMRGDFGDYMPTGMSTHFFSTAEPYESRLTQGERTALYATLYDMARQIHSYIKNAKNTRNSRPEVKHNGEDEKFYLVPHTDPDGSVYYIDRFTNRVMMSMVRQPNGLFSYYGPRKMMTVLGGRGELGDLLRRVEDNEFFYDRHKKVA